MKVAKQFPVVFDKEKGIYIPQPTRFWILDKELHSAISRLEEKGFIKYWEDKVSKDEELFNFFVKLHLKEIHEREKLISNKKYPEYVVHKLLSTGIGGIQDYNKKPFKVKCLHLWTAYHLGDEKFRNPIGEFVIERL
ncbi:DUF501 domain-containing protein [Persephonella sp. IF05-L8]|uniref:DUF501 domain-containing protein n=1 Tax=Persephonella sp. IF05-L8 TaxID=1158338 RepID=UPI00049575AC